MEYTMCEDTLKRQFGCLKLRIVFFMWQEQVKTMETIQLLSQDRDETGTAKKTV